MKDDRIKCRLSVYLYNKEGYQHAHIGQKHAQIKINPSSGFMLSVQRGNSKNYMHSKWTWIAEAFMRQK